ncbi:MAG: cysteine hydrolase, partial [Gemmatimonadota bacterium]|nr:cysteine hydrolase [Gemmatimonadota bacterium]
RGALRAAVTVLEAFRQRNRPVVHVRVAFDDEYHRRTSAGKSFAYMQEHRLMLEADPASAIVSELTPLPGELVVTKGCQNAFVGTNLAERLVRMRPTQLVMGGVATNYVVEATARYATDVGYDVVILEDLCASFSEEMHEFAITKVLPRVATIASSADFLTELQP